ncbi:MAG: cupin domain-containing protein [Candidatus Pacearchaeota archaeon]
MIKPYKSNIEKETLKNKNYRKVLHTGKNIQLVVMSLKSNEDIPFEVHKNHDQFIRVESGTAKAIAEGKKYLLKDGDVIIIPAGVRHYVCNFSKIKPLKLYTLYAPPEHPSGTVHKTQADALKYAEKHKD